jgi:hypothetical protein
VTGLPEVRVDSLVEGLVGYTDRKAKGRVVMVSVWNWVAFLDEDGRQWISYPGRFIVREGPRPERARTDVPERFRR